VPLHPHREGLDPAQCQPGVDGPAPPHRVLGERELLGERVVVGDQRAATTSEWPPMYFVVECNTTSAPSASGVCR